MKGDTLMLVRVVLWHVMCTSERERIKKGRREVTLQEIVNRCSIVVQRELAKGFFCRDILILGSSSQGDLFYDWEDTSGNLALYLNCGWGIWSTCKQRGS